MKRAPETAIESETEMGGVETVQPPTKRARRRRDVQKPATKLVTAMNRLAKTKTPAKRRQATMGVIRGTSALVDTVLHELCRLCELGEKRSSGRQARMLRTMYAKGLERPPPTFALENELVQSGVATKVVGVDEAGRGPLAGPVVVAACWLSETVDVKAIGIRDSKTVSTEEKREEVYAKLKSLQRDGLADFEAVRIDRDEIDRLNILQATFEGMRRSTKALCERAQADYAIVDGNKVPPQFPVDAESSVKGDSKHASVAAASIVAKVTRDRIMVQAHELWPRYGFAKNKGYPTSDHIVALEEYGPCEIHRLTFEPLKSGVSAAKKR
jgi:ribonuclease HII